MGSIKKKADDSGIRRVLAKEIRELSKVAVVDETLSTDAFEARALPDGRVLQISLLGGPQRGRLFPSRASAEKAQQEYLGWCREAAEQRANGGTEHTRTLLPPIDDFLRDVEAHAKSLGPRLKIPAEVLDLTPESLDAVDKALKKIPWAKRQVPDLVTPLVAYLGEVMRKATGGQWSKVPTLQPREVPIYDPAELVAFDAARRRMQPIAIAAADKAAAEAKAQGASEPDVKIVWSMARQAAFQEVNAAAPKPIRIEIRENNEPIITTRGGGLFQPFASVFLPMVEPSRRIPLRSSPGVMVTRSRNPAT